MRTIVSICQRGCMGMCSKQLICVRSMDCVRRLACGVNALALVSRAAVPLAACRATAQGWELDLL